MTLPPQVKAGIYSGLWCIFKNQGQSCLVRPFATEAVCGGKRGGLPGFSPDSEAPSHCLLAGHAAFKSASSSVEGTTYMACMLEHCQQVAIAHAYIHVYMYVCIVHGYMYVYVHACIDVCICSLCILRQTLYR